MKQTRRDQLIAHSRIIICIGGVIGCLALLQGCWQSQKTEKITPDFNSPILTYDIIGQIPGEVEKKNNGCLSCHTKSDAPTMHKSPAVRLACVDCHGGHPEVIAPNGGQAGSPAYEEAMANYDRGQVQVLNAQLEQNSAKLELVVSKLERTVLHAPFDGLVLSGDLTQRLGSAVKQGEVLFEVAPLSAYRVILWVDEHQIADIEESQKGRLVLNSLPEESLDFTITRITAITEARDGGNYFRVESLLQDLSDRLRPGMEGIGKVEVGERKLIVNFTEPLIRWVKLKYWAMWP